PGGNVEYVELYNPTTAPINIGPDAAPSTGFYIFDHNNHSLPSGNATPTPIPLVHISTYVPANKYYLIANVSTPFSIAGSTRSAHAYYDAPNTGNLYLNDSNASGTGVADSVPNKLDALSWTANGPGSCPNTPQEGSCFLLTSSFGGDQVLMRRTDPISP